jgi:hypothetical protein
MQNEENEKDVSGKGKIHQEIAQNKYVDGDFAVHCYGRKGQRQKEYEPKKVESSTKKLAHIRRPTLKCCQ